MAALALATFSTLTSLKAADDPYLVKEFKLDGLGNLKVQTSGGNIQVSAHESNTVRVEMYLQKNGRSVDAGDERGEELLEDFKIDISQSANTVSAIAEKKNLSGFNFGNQASISFRVYVPKRISCSLHTSGGSIDLTGVEGIQEVKTSGGNLNLQDIEGKTEGHTSGGNILIADYTGIIKARTSGGSIKLQDSKGEFDIHTSGGSIKIEEVAGNIDAHTSGGSIKANLLTLDQHVRLHTSGGNIDAVLPAGIGLDLDLKGERVNTRLQNFNGKADKDRIRGSMNGGGIQVVMSTSGGHVDVEYQ